jgi:hypothetical protein
MSEYASVIKESFHEYGEGIQSFVLDILNECENKITDGIMAELSKKEDESSAFNFLKSQGYNISYTEFERYYEDSKSVINDNEDLLRRLMEEESTSELSDEDLEGVAGGINWRAVGIGVGVGLAVAALIVVTAACPVAAPATGPAIVGITTAGWGIGAVAGAGAAAGAATVGVGAAVGAGVAAGAATGALVGGAVAAADSAAEASSSDSGPRSYKAF